MCANDDTVSDALDRTCTGWYNDNTDSCGLQDDADFVASNACC
jgi:hypothetical protein